VTGANKIDLSTRVSRDNVRSLLAHLHGAEAWKLFDAYLEGEEHRLTDSIANCSQSNEVLRDAGRLKAIREMRRWPVTMVHTIDQLNQREDTALKAEKEHTYAGTYESSGRQPHASR
jgi:hypothetical protein